MEAKRCEACGGRSAAADNYCSYCGKALPDQAALNDHESVNERIFLGDYELMEYDNEPPEESDWGDDPIYDRDGQAKPSIAKELAASGRRALIHLVLIALLLVLGVSAYAGIQTVAARREAKAAELVRQAQQQKEAEAKAQRDAYLRIWREFLITAQAQSNAFALNLQELEGIEEKRWLSNIFLGGIYNGMVERFRSSDDFQAMDRRQADLTNRFQSLDDPPAGAQDLTSTTRELQALSAKVNELFIGEITETTPEEIRRAVEAFDQALTQAGSAE